MGKKKKLLEWKEKILRGAAYSMDFQGLKSLCPADCMEKPNHMKPIERWFKE